MGKNLSIEQAKDFLGQRVIVKDNFYPEDFHAVLLGFADPKSGIVKKEPPKDPSNLPFVVVVRVESSHRDHETSIRYQRYYVSEIVPACPDCGSDYDIEHGYCPVCYCGHLVCVD